MEIEINNKSLTQAQLDTINETVNGLNFIALNLEKNKLQQLSRLVRAVMVDFISWSKNSYMLNNKSCDEEYFDEYLIDTSMLAAMEFLAKFALLDDIKIKNEFIEIISKMESVLSPNKKHN
ncbi:MAG: hypothetical protein PQ612_00465 [Rickettsiales bacterium]|nr:hypothetical protein [Pseudomonadota bacterium]MDA0965613.1 hypothetical protein [Pseudomonadota bacterium]MDG4542937.1 hypothetical protein [Rickettsiales bacterium]MDG4544615.1 hypothetical protein [Rickettsiales bacterium]MDG4546737.1 hypothetical protein [Rickettsiales bacterium]